MKWEQLYDCETETICYLEIQGVSKMEGLEAIRAIFWISNLLRIEYKDKKIGYFTRDFLLQTGFKED